VPLPLRAELIGSNQVTAAGITVSGRNAPALALCRALIAAGHDPATPLEVYRATTLCLRVSSIAEGAKLTVKDGPDGKPRFATFRAGPNSDESCGGDGPMRFLAGDAFPAIPAAETLPASAVAMTEEIS
jgi:hypothetical protein